MISIALATYNGEKYIEEQLESLLRQSLPFDELIICDDCSTDNTRSLLNKYAVNDSRIKLYYNEVNIGFKENFNKIITLCKGDLIAFCDQDDIWLDNHLEILFNSINGYDLAVGNALIYDDNKGSFKSLIEIGNFDPSLRNINEHVRYSIMFYQNSFQGASMLLKRDFLNRYSPVPHSVRYHDVWFALLAALEGKFCFINEPITFYRIHNNNASGSHVHHWPIRTMIAHLVKNDIDNNRKDIISILKHIDLGKDSNDFVKFADFYFNRRKTILGRLKNLMFEIKNYRKIYN